MHMGWQLLARLREKTKTAVTREPSASRNVSGEAPMMAKHLDIHVLEQHDTKPPDRRLRNRIIIANAIAWIAIIIAVRLIFF